MDWDLLAPVWPLLEREGLVPETLIPMVSSGDMSGPTVVLGAGQGLLVEALKPRLGPVQGVDSSAEMIRMARLRRDLELVLASADRVPLPDAEAGLVVVATGVLDGADPEGARRVMREARRLLRPGGSLVAAAMVPRPELLPGAFALGICSGRSQHNDRILEIRAHAADLDRLSQRVAGWTGCPLPQARDRLIRFEHVVATIAVRWMDIFAALELEGVEDVGSYVQRAYGGEVVGFDHDEVLALVRAGGLRPVDSNLEQMSGGTLVVVAKRVD